MEYYMESEQARQLMSESIRHISEVSACVGETTRGKEMDTSKLN